MSLLTTVNRCNEDKISQLPEALLLNILSLLLTKDVVAMSVLSKQWKSIWKMVPKLKFVCDTYDIETFKDNVCRTLLLHKAPVLQSLHLVASFEILDEYVSIELGVLLGISYGRNVRELKLEAHWVDGTFRFPRSLYSCENLESLELIAECGSILVDVLSSVCLKSLKTLHLHDVGYKDNVGYKDDESVVSLLSGCFRLENLVIHRNGYDDVKTFTIAVPSLQRLTIVDTVEFNAYVINCPSLKYLKIEARSGIESCLIENMPELVEADININNSDNIIYENILGSLTSVKRLSLKISPLESKFPTGRIFDQLVYLELSTCEDEWGNLLTLLLDTSPNLRALKLIGLTNRCCHVGLEKWNQPKNVPECLLRHLETFAWTCYECIIEEEKDVAKYILRNASRLKKVTFSQIEVNWEEREEMINELESVVKASNSCHLVFEFNLLYCS